MLRWLTLLSSIFFAAAPAVAEPDHSITISSANLNEDRQVDLHLPAASEEPMAIVVVSDGEDFGELAAAYVDHLSHMAGTGPTLVVAIHNTDRIRDLYTDTRPFAAFITDELMPLVRKKFATNDFELLFTFSSGMGLAETFLLEDAAAFDAYIVAGVGLDFEEEKVRWRTIMASDHPPLYFSTEGAPSHRAEPAREMLDRPERQPHFMGRILDGQTHDTAGAVGLFEGLAALLPAAETPAQE